MIPRFSPSSLSAAVVDGSAGRVRDPADDRVIVWQHYQAESASQKNYAADSSGPPAYSVPGEPACPS